MELYFFRSREYKNHYLIYRGIKGESPERWLAKLTHTGQYTESGYRQLDIEMGYVIKTDAPVQFLDFIVNKYSSHHIPNPDYDTTIFRSWYEFPEQPETKKWLDEFYEYQNQKRQELLKESTKGMQTALF